MMPTIDECPKCGDTLYPFKHHVMCQDCGAMVECNSDVQKGVFGFVCAKCAPTSDSIQAHLEQARLTVKPIVDAEKEAENIGDLMQIHLRTTQPTDS